MIPELLYFSDHKSDACRDSGDVNPSMLSVALFDVKHTLTTPLALLGTLQKSHGCVKINEPIFFDRVFFQTYRPTVDSMTEAVRSQLATVQKMKY